MKDDLGRSEEIVRRTLAAKGIAGELRILSKSARTADLAAAALGCSVGQIVKSLVFQGTESGCPLLVLVSGSNRVNLERLSEVVGEPIEKADADAVRAVTGFAIGGVPPLGHLRSLRTYIDADLMGYEQLWAAAGSPRAVFPLSPGELRRISDGDTLDVD